MERVSIKMEKKLIKQVFKSNNDVNELIKEIIDAERDSDNKK